MMLLLINILLMGVVSWWWNRRWKDSAVHLYYWPGLLLKIISGWGLVLLYQKYYGYGDLLYYHQKGVTVAASFWQDPLQYIAGFIQKSFFFGSGNFLGEERVSFFIDLISPVFLLANGSIWIASAWLSFFSFLGLYWLVVRLAAQYSGSALAAAVAFLLWPSTLFWTSSITKEALVMPAIAVLVASFLPYISGKGRSTLLQWIVALLGAWIIWRIKYYFALPLFAVLLALVLAQFLQRKNISRTSFLLLTGGALVLTLLLISQLHPNLHPNLVLQVLVDNYSMYTAGEEEGRQLHFPDLQPNLWSLLLHTPKALAGGVLMPLPLLPFRLEVLPFLAGTENLLLLLLLIASFYKLYRTPVAAFSLSALGLSLYVCSLAVAMAIASPNFGSLLRYRTAYLPFMVFLLLYWLFPLQKGRKKGVGS